MQSEKETNKWIGAETEKDVGRIAQACFFIHMLCAKYRSEQGGPGSLLLHVVAYLGVTPIDFRKSFALNRIKEEKLGFVTKF